MGIEELTEKLQKFKKKVIEKTDKGIQALKGSPDAKGATETGKEVLKEVSGLKARLIQEGTNFVKTYMKDNVTKENSTGATLGALGEYIVKKTVKGVTAVADTLTEYIENEAVKYHRLDTIPELEAAKALINEYAKDKEEQGDELLQYKGIEMVLGKTEKDLSIRLKNKGKTIGLTYLLKDTEISYLNKDFEIITGDLLKRLDKLSDPATLRIDKRTTLKIPLTKGEATYLVSFKKEDGTYEVSYTPENKKTGIMLKYTLEKQMQEGPKEDPIPDMLKKE